MFASKIRCGISTYSAFLQSGVHNKLSDVPFAQRGAALRDLYRALTPKERKELVAAAKKEQYIRVSTAELEPAKEVFVRPCLLTDYQLFVRSQFRKGEQGQTLAKVAALWRNRDRKA